MEERLGEESERARHALRCQSLPCSLWPSGPSPRGLAISPRGDASPLLLPDHAGDGAIQEEPGRINSFGGNVQAGTREPRARDDATDV